MPLTSAAREIVSCSPSRSACASAGGGGGWSWRALRTTEEMSCLREMEERRARQRSSMGCQLRDRVNSTGSRRRSLCLQSMVQRRESRRESSPRKRNSPFLSSSLEITPSWLRSRNTKASTEEEKSDMRRCCRSPMGVLAEYFLALIFTRPRSSSSFSSSCPPPAAFVSSIPCVPDKEVGCALEALSASCTAEARARDWRRSLSRWRSEICREASACATSCHASCSQKSWKDKVSSCLILLDSEPSCFLRLTALKTLSSSM
mmetsp:Transcript_21052/g.47406  ORF Transcript_21052/g.47406 Transcript_21052/m.47406 type:complete len:261 (-) Transcript_21052:687-1469(-)